MINKFSKILIIIFLSCATSSDPDDPLKNSKKIISSGHKSLYYNGAFEVKGTSLKLIPAFSEAEVFIYKKNVSFAKEAFAQNIKKASESVEILKEGKKISFEFGDKISKEGEIISEKLKDSTTDYGTVFIEKSLAKSYGIFSTSTKSYLETNEAVIKESVLLKNKLDEYGKELSEIDFPAPNRPEFSERAKVYTKEFSEDLNSFVVGYVNLEDYINKSVEDSKKNYENESQSVKISETVENFILESNKKLGNKLQEIQMDFSKGTAQEFEEANKELEKVSEGEGLSLAIFKSLARVTKGIFYNGFLKPFSQIGVVTVGYAAVNSFWPIAIIGNGAARTVMVMVEVLKVGTKGIVYLIAPSAKIALSSIINNSKFIAKEAYIGADKSVRAGANAGIFISEKSINSLGIVTETSGTYVLAPTLGSVSFAGKSIHGAGVAVGGTVTGGTIALGTESARLTTKYGSKVADGAVSGIGTGVAGITSLGYGTYYVAKAVGIPTGVTLKGGVVLSYEMIAQLSAHSVLAVSDCSYLVLSMEGGNWVIYAVKDTTGKAKSLLTGSVIDLEKVRKEGNEIKKVPVSQEEIDKILEKEKKD